MATTEQIARYRALVLEHNDAPSWKKTRLAREIERLERDMDYGAGLGPPMPCSKCGARGCLGPDSFHCGGHDDGPRDGYRHEEPEGSGWLRGGHR